MGHLYDAGITGGVIQKRTGDKSLDALRCYERTTISQNLEVSASGYSCFAQTCYMLLVSYMRTPTLQGITIVNWNYCLIMVAHNRSKTCYMVRLLVSYMRTPTLQAAGDFFIRSK